MAVLTPISDESLRILMALYGLPLPARVEGIPAGSVNSNFAVEVDGVRLFLRIYEEQDVAGAVRETAILQHLAAAGVPTPAPCHRLDGRVVSVVDGKAAALFPWRAGGMRCQAGVTPADAHRIGEALARVHIAGAGIHSEPGRFRFEDLQRRVVRIGASANPEVAGLAGALGEALGRIHTARDRSLPSGLTHGDLFRDNVLWDTRGSLAALLDFESACEGSFAYDLMVTVLAWCFGDGFDPRLARAMRAGYETIRPLVDAERRALRTEGRFAALRFAITRVTDYAMRETVAGPRVVKDWRRFWLRFQTLETLGDEGVRHLLWP